MLWGSEADTPPSSPCFTFSNQGRWTTITTIHSTLVMLWMFCVKRRLKGNFLNKPGAEIIISHRPDATILPKTVDMCSGGTLMSHQCQVMGEYGVSQQCGTSTAALKPGEIEVLDPSTALPPSCCSREVSQASWKDGFHSNSDGFTAVNSPKYVFLSYLTVRIFPKPS